MKVLVAGAGGFIGGHIVKELADRGHEVWCGVRPTTSRERLGDPRLKVVNLSYDSPAALERELAAQHTVWDAVVWNLGLTRAVHFSDFNRVNFELMRTFVLALERLALVPRRFIYMSSLSAQGRGDERTFKPLRADGPLAPATRYGLSKAKAETWLASHPEVPWVVLRPTGVYGPHDRDYAMMVDSVAWGIDFSVGLRRQMLTFIHATDLARAVAQAVERAPLHKAYILAEGRAYTQAEFRAIVKKAVGRRFVLPVKLPLWAARAVCAVSGAWGRARLKPVTLNPDKYKILAQRNWNCDISPAQADFGFDPQVTLEQGFGELAELRRRNKKKKS